MSIYKVEDDKRGLCMKKATVFLVSAILLLLAGNGYTSSAPVPFTFDSCELGIDKIHVSLLAASGNFVSPTSFRVRIFTGKKAVAMGAYRLELLKLPQTPLAISIPLSNQLRGGELYKVQIEAQAGSNLQLHKEYSAKKATGSSSGNFFKRVFRAIPEPSEMRNRPGKSFLQTELGIN
jgi:hypothetical protein